jgi:hypothetical protein
MSSNSPPLYDGKAFLEIPEISHVAMITNTHRIFANTFSMLPNPNIDYID